MKRSMVLNLLKKLNKLNLDDNSINKILSLDEQTLEKLVNINEYKFENAVYLALKLSPQDIMKALEIYSSSRYAEYVYKILTNRVAIKHNVNFIGAKLVNDAIGTTNAYYLSEYFAQEKAIESNIFYEGAKLITNENHVKYLYNVLTNEDAINANMALEGAYLICASPNYFNAEGISHVFMNKNYIDADLAIPFAKIINESKASFNVNAILSLTSMVKLDKLENKNIILKIANMINVSPNVFNANRILYFLFGYDLNDDFEYFMEGVKKINMCQEENLSIFVTLLLKNKELRAMGMSLPLVNFALGDTSLLQTPFDKNRVYNVLLKIAIENPYLVETINEFSRKCCEKDIIKEKNIEQERKLNYVETLIQECEIRNNNINIKEVVNSVTRKRKR